MTVRIEPSRAEGRIVAPPSKSIAHRALICGALSENSTIFNVAASADVRATLECLRSLGATVKQEGTTVRIGGFSPFTTPDRAEPFCNESGSTLRFLLPLCMLSGRPVTLTGSRRLFERPLGIYEEIAAAQGIRFEKAEDRVTVSGTLSGGEYVVAGNVSSQFITGLLTTLPLLKEDSSLTVTDPFESASYAALTVDVLRAFGVCVTQCGNCFTVRGGQRPQSQSYTVEGDCSNAAFSEGLNVLGGNVKVEGLSETTLQGDRVYRQIFAALRAGEKQFDLSDCPDLGPVAFALAAALGGARFTGTARLRIKESDRVAAMAEELEKFGIPTRVSENAVEVCAGELRTPTVPLCGHNDHRIVMALALLCTRTGGVIEGAEAVAKSYPDFFEAWKSLRIGITEL